MKHILILLLPIYLVATTSFITPMEYASQLYKNPRGIGCHRCHGEGGEGKIVARYKHKGIDMVFEGKAINKIDYNRFYKALNKRNRGMPRYFLTDKEVQALYFYMQKDENDDKR